MKNKLASISLVALMVLILAGVLLLGFMFASLKFMKNSKQVNRINTISSQIDTLLDLSYNSVNPEKQSRKTEFILNSKEMYLFFSAGGKPIYLSHVFEGSGTDKIERDMDLQKEHYLKFERPNVPECKNTACVCYYELKSPLWKPSAEEPYIEPSQVFIINNKSEKGFSSKAIQCKSVGDDINQVVYFGNSRGRDESYFESIAKMVHEKNTGNARDTYYPISMDLSLLSQNQAKDDGNIFFGSVNGMQDEDIFGINVDVTDDYNYMKQDNGYVRILTNEYYWENGVVIGGMGFSKNRADRRKHILQGPPIVIKMETVKDHPGIIGVCIHDNCLFENAEKNLIEKQKIQENLKETKQNARNEFIKFDSYLQSDFKNGFKNLKLKPDTKEEFLKGLDKELNDLFTSFNKLKDVDIEVVFSPLTHLESFIPTLRVNGETIYESDPLPVKVPLKSSSEQFTNDIMIKNYKDNKLVLSDGTSRTIDVVQWKKLPIIYFKK